ncbi:zinc-binding dehydrogenase [Alloalcanivorax xenomutans]|uniref:zinc-binding dehydrogenase n=1 Tax=Alloalcanivorax xenomutans TaxID=1094342 RepID=UPI0024E19F79|nr:zinc-binding dehydrogenase [Alloalcanivorax xenomutans]
MQAWQINDGTMALGPFDTPEPAPDQVRIRVRAVGINRADILQVKGMYPAPPGFDQRVPGLEYAGEVDAVGSKVTHRQVGDRVMGLIPSGAYAEYLVVHEDEPLTLPDNLDFATGATIPEAFLTAYRALFLDGGLQPGQWCLIRPASAGVGLAGTQLAAALGARPIGSSRNPANLRTAEGMGLMATVTEDDTLAEQLKSITGDGVAVIMDMVGPDWSQVLKGLRTEGTLSLVGVLGGAQTMMDLRPFLQRRLKITAMTMRSQTLDRRIAMAGLFNDRLAPLFAAERLRPLPMETFAFADALEAHRHMVEDDFSGKRVLVL